MRSIWKLWLLVSGWDTRRQSYQFILHKLHIHWATFFIEGEMSHLAPTCEARWDTSKIKAKSELKMLKVNKILGICKRETPRSIKHHSEEKKSLIWMLIHISMVLFGLYIIGVGIMPPAYFLDIFYYTIIFRPKSEYNLL